MNTKEKIIAFLEDSPEAKTRDIVNGTDSNWGAIQRALTELLEEKRVEREKVGHGFRYSNAPDAAPERPPRV